MRVPHVKFFLAAVAIAHVTQAKITASVAVNTTHSDTESSSSAGRDKGDEMMSANVVVKEVLAEAKTTTFAARSPTKHSEESTYTANRDDGERMNNLEESTSKVAETIKNSVIPRLKNVFAKKKIEGEYEKLLMIAKKPEGKMMKKLMKNYKDKSIAELIVHAKMEIKHKGAAVKLEKAQMNYWLDKKKSAKDVFELLELNEAGEVLLVHPLYSYWSTYVEKFNKRYPLKKVSVVDFLTPTYYDDPALAHLIVNGKKHEFSQSAALQLEREQHTKWMGQGFHPDEVFEKLGLSTAEDGLLTHPLFGYWYYTYIESDTKNLNQEMIKFLTKEASKKKKTFENFLKNEVEKAKLETKSRVDELFVELKLNKVEDGLFTNPLFKFWRDCLEKFNAGKPRESQTSVVKSLQTIYGDEDLFYLLEAEQKITTSAEYAKKMEKDLFATWVVNKKPLDDVFKLLGFNRVGYELLEGPLEKFVKVATEVMLSKTSNIQTKEQAFVENEIRNGVDLASHAGKLRSTKFEKGLFRLWFTYEKNPKEVFEMLFFKDDLVKILNDGGNLFEIPRFVTFLKYAEAYSGTKRLATAEELEAHGKQTWKIDPTAEVEYVDRKTDVGFIMSDKFYSKIDTLHKMISSAKESSIKATRFAGQRVEDRLFRFWTSKNDIVPMPDYLFEYFKLNTEMTPEQLFDNPMFHWWIDYMEYFCNRFGGENQKRYFVKDVFGSSDGLEKLRTEYNTPENKEFAKKVLTELLNERIIEESDSTVIEKSGLTVIEKELIGLDDKIATWYKSALARQKVMIKTEEKLKKVFGD